jgi:trehalose-6-phosphate synthase
VGKLSGLYNRLNVSPVVLDYDYNTTDYSLIERLNMQQSVRELLEVKCLDVVAERGIEYIKEIAFNDLKEIQKYLLQSR